MLESKTAGLLEPRINLRLKYLCSLAYAKGLRTLEVE